MYEFENCNIEVTAFNEKNHVCQNTGVIFCERFNSWGNRSFILFPKPYETEGNHDSYFELLNGHYALGNANAIESMILNKFWDVAGEDYHISLFESMRKNYATIVDTILNPAKAFVQPRPEWVKEADLQLLAARLEQEFGATIHHIDNCYIAEYQGQMWDIATGEGSFTVEQGSYDYMYFPKMGQNLAQRLSFLSLRQSLHLSRETVKSYLYRDAKELSNKEFAEWFEKWLGNSSWKSKYWMHHDMISDQALRVSVIANHAKDMLICTTADGIHVFSGKHHFIVKRLPHLFYRFANYALENGKDYSVSGTGWALTW